MLILKQTIDDCVAETTEAGAAAADVAVAKASAAVAYDVRLHILLSRMLSRQNIVDLHIDIIFVCHHSDILLQLFNHCLIVSDLRQLDIGCHINSLYNVYLMPTPR